MRSVEDEHWWYIGTRAIAMDALRGLDFGRDARILDAGCGTGGNLAVLRQLGTVVGVDFSELALGLAASRGIARLARASVTDLPFPDAMFDLVTSFDVLCHRSIDDDVAAFAELRRVLKPGGALLLRLPAFEWLRGAHDVVVHTARRYTASGLIGKLRRAGFEPGRITYVNGLLLPIAAAKRSVERARGAAGDDLGKSPALVEAVFRSAMALERRLLRRFDLPLGVSVQALARRPANA